MSASISTPVWPTVSTVAVRRTVLASIALPWLAGLDPLAAALGRGCAMATASVLFKQQVRFAELTTTPLTPANAAHTHRLALALLHFSPEPRVIEKLIDSAEMLGRPGEAAFYLIRLEAAFTRQ